MWCCLRYWLKLRRHKCYKIYDSHRIYKRKISRNSNRNSRKRIAKSWKLFKTMKQRKKGRQRNTRKKGREKKIFHIKSASSHIGAKRTRKKRNGITYHYSTKQMQLIFLMPYPSDMTPVFFSLIVYELTCIHRKELIGLSTVWYFPSLRVAVIQS